MADQVDLNATDGGTQTAPTPRRGRALATVLTALIVLTVAGGWAYDHRVEYGIAYGQIFEELSDTYELSVSCPGACVTESGPGCCHADGTCLPADDLAALVPVEAPKPAAGEAAATPVAL